jgi:hypothetical protein
MGFMSRAPAGLPSQGVRAAHNFGQALRAPTIRGAASQCYRARAVGACRRAAPAVRQEPNTINNSTEITALCPRLYAKPSLESAHEQWVGDGFFYCKKRSANELCRLTYETVVRPHLSDETVVRPHLSPFARDRLQLADPTRLHLAMSLNP